MKGKRRHWKASIPHLKPPAHFFRAYSSHPRGQVSLGPSRGSLGLEYTFRTEARIKGVWHTPNLRLGNLAEKGTAFKKIG
jgi:hypothetical protein